MYEFSWGGVEVCSMPVVEGIFLGQQSKTHFLASHNSESVATAKQLRISWFNVAKDVRKSEEKSAKFFEPAFEEKVLRYSKNLQKEYWNFLAEVGKTNFGEKSNEELAACFEKAHSLMEGMMNAFQVTQPEFLLKPMQRLKQIIAGRKELELEKTFAELTTYTELDAINLEEIAFNKIAAGGATRQACEQHVSEFPWLMLNTYALEEGILFLQERAKATDADAKIEEKMLKEKHEMRERQKKLFSVLGSEAEYIAKLFQDLAFNRIEEKTCWASELWLCRPLYAKIASRTGETLRNLAEAYRKHEVIELLLRSKQLPHEEIARRRKYYLFHYKHPSIEFFSGWEAEEKASELGVMEKPQNIGVIKGVCASPGKAVGKVRIIITAGLGEYARELKEFKEGEILVTGMTQITMVPICRKAAAIVTNEGGITSHAAIISRELGIPCVVGTHIATRELKDGDLVEVDAEKGVVKKL